MRQPPVRLMAPWLLVMPSTFLATFALFFAARGPLFLDRTCDPDYPYLFNGLNVATGQAPGHIDHPGTPVQVFGGALLRIMHPFSEGEDLTREVITRPEWHLKVFNLTMMGGYFVFLVFGGWLVWHKSASVAAALLIQATPFFLGEQFRFAVRFAPEPMLLIVTTLFGLTAALCAFESGPTKLRVIALLSFLASTGIATKLIFVPLVIGVVPMLRTWKERVTYLGLVAAFTCAWLLPIAAQLDRIASWVGGLLGRQGYYGKGAPGLISTNYLGNLFRLISHHPLLSTVLAVSLATIVYGFASRKSGGQDSVAGSFFKLLVGLTAAEALQLLIAAKFGESRYILPSLVLCAFNVLMLVLLAREWWRAAPNRPYLRAPGVCLAFILASTMAAGMRANYLGYQRLRAGHASVRRVAEGMPGPFVYFPGASSLAHALWFGNYYAGERYHEALQNLAFRDQKPFYILRKRTGKLYSGATLTEIHSVLNPGKPLFFMGITNNEAETFSILPKNAKVERLFERSGEGIYKVELPAAD